uniref:SHSP domain-containing protein n=1 Tax=Cyprinus carpio carpio TaxID=630221 RepID=A0A9J8B909_CYPCA
MDFDLPPSLQVSSIPWERILPPLFPWWNGTIGPYSWTLTELLILVSEHTGVAQIACDHNRFTVQVDVKHFSPEDLLVKVVGDYVVDGSGLVTRPRNHSNHIPNEVDIMALESAMSTEGMLVISAPLTQQDITADLHAQTHMQFPQLMFRFFFSSSLF